MGSEKFLARTGEVLLFGVAGYEGIGSGRFSWNEDRRFSGGNGEDGAL